MENILDPSHEKTKSYCTFCPRLCRFSCPVAEVETRETVTPWGLMRLTEMLRKQSVEPSAEVAELFSHCTGCGQCQTWCKHENDVPSAVFDVRSATHELGFVTEISETLTKNFAKTTTPSEKLRRMPALKDIFNPEAKVAYFVDCDVRANKPKRIVAIGKMLHQLTGDKVRLVTRRGSSGVGCCGFPLLAAGDRDGFETQRKTVDRQLANVHTVITDCSQFAALSKSEKWGGNYQRPVHHILDIIADNLEKSAITNPIDDAEVLLHDSCFVGRHLDLYEETRSILDVIGANGREFSRNRSDASCCGAGSNYPLSNPEGSLAMAQARIDQCRNEDAEKIVCGSSKCSHHFNSAEDGVAFDLVDLVCEAMGLA